MPVRHTSAVGINSKLNEFESYLREVSAPIAEHPINRMEELLLDQPHQAQPQANAA